jgi:hypothetical protein
MPVCANDLVDDTPQVFTSCRKHPSAFSTTLEARV